MAVTQLSRPRGARLRADAAPDTDRLHVATSLAVGRVPDPGRYLPGALRGAPLSVVRGGGNAFAHMVVLGRLGEDGTGTERPNMDGATREGHARRRGSGPHRRDSRHRVF